MNVFNSRWVGGACGWCFALLCLLASGCDRRDDTKPTGAAGARNGNAAVQDGQGPQAGWFTEITSDRYNRVGGVGLDFVHETGAKGELHLAEIMGAGVALFDYDNDGDLDIYLINGNRELPRMVKSRAPTNRLFRQDANGRFVDVTEESGLGDGGYGMGVAIGDIDNDGDTDVYVTNFGRDTLFRNRGDDREAGLPRFEDITVQAGITADGWSCSATFLDYDLDGFLDLYVTQYIEFNLLKSCTDGAGRPSYCSPLAHPPIHDLLLHNNGDGTFTDVSEQAGIASTAAAGLGVVSEDFNDDGRPDIYVANDGYPNQLWISSADGTFHDAALLSGAAYSWNGAPEAGMGVLAADLNNDGHLDLFLTHLANESNTIYRNLGGTLGFSDVTGESGLAFSSIPFTGFGTCAFDVELDGDLDLLVVNGRVVRGNPRPDSDMPPPWNMYAEPNLFYVNDGTGKFTLLKESVAELCDRVEITRGLAVGDIDSDGDQDVLINNIQGPARLYRNDAPRKGHWLSVRARDPQLRRDAIGAVVTAVVGDRRLLRTISSGSSYLSASEPIAHFGLGETARVDRIEVRWPGGVRETFPGTPADRFIVLRRGEGDRER